MISMKELIKDIPISDIPIAHQHNLEELLLKINKIRTAYNKSMTVTSGYRTMQDHIRIYNAKGIFDEKKIPMQSGHLRGYCCDISDVDGKLRIWILANLSLMKEIGFWFEDFRYTKGWVHFGTMPPKSNKRIFIPYSGAIPHPEIWDGNYPKELD